MCISCSAHAGQPEVCMLVGMLSFMVTATLICWNLLSKRHVHVHVYELYVVIQNWLLVHQQIHVLMRDEKEGRKKQARSNKQQQGNTAHPSTCHTCTLYMLLYMFQEFSNLSGFMRTLGTDYITDTIASERTVELHSHLCSILHTCTERQGLILLE